MENSINYNVAISDIPLMENPITQTKITDNAKTEKMESFKKTIPFRLGGIMLLLITICAIKSGIFYDNATQATDITFAFVTVPLGLMFAFCPINACDDIDEEESEVDYGEE